MLSRWVTYGSQLAQSGCLAPPGALPRPLPLIEIEQKTQKEQKTKISFGPYHFW